MGPSYPSYVSTYSRHASGSTPEKNQDRFFFTTLPSISPSSFTSGSDEETIFKRTIFELLVSINNDLTQNHPDSGSTFTGLLVLSKSEIYAINLGDSQAVLVTDQGKQSKTPVHAIGEDEEDSHSKYFLELTNPQKEINALSQSFPEVSFNCEDTAGITLSFNRVLPPKEKNQALKKIAQHLGQTDPVFRCSGLTMTRSIGRKDYQPPWLKKLCTKTTFKHAIVLTDGAYEPLNQLAVSANPYLNQKNAEQLITSIPIEYQPDDATAIIVDLESLETLETPFFFGVADGHKKNGDIAANLLKEKMETKLPRLLEAKLGKKSCIRSCCKISTGIALPALAIGATLIPSVTSHLTTIATTVATALFKITLSALAVSIIVHFAIPLAAAAVVALAAYGIYKIYKRGQATPPASTTVMKDAQGLSASDTGLMAEATP